MRVKQIDWETDGVAVELPTAVTVPSDLEEDEIADYLSDQYGWLVNGFVMEAESFGAEDVEGMKDIWWAYKIDDEDWKDYTLYKRKHKDSGMNEMEMFMEWRHDKEWENDEDIRYYLRFFDNPKSAQKFSGRTKVIYDDSGENDDDDELIRVYGKLDSEGLKYALSFGDSIDWESYPLLFSGNVLSDYKQRAAESFGAETFAARGTGNLYKSQEKVLKAYRDSGGKENNYDSLPPKIVNKLKSIRNSETLWSDVNRWLWDNPSTLKNPYGGFHSSWDAESFGAELESGEAALRIVVSEGQLSVYHDASNHLLMRRPIYAGEWDKIMASLNAAESFGAELLGYPHSMSDRQKHRIRKLGGRIDKAMTRSEASKYIKSLMAMPLHAESTDCSVCEGWGWNEELDMVCDADGCIGGWVVPKKPSLLERGLELGAGMGMGMAGVAILFGLVGGTVGFAAETRKKRRD